MIVGNIGAEGKKMDYTVIGDNVNLGARVEGLTRKYNTDIIITEYTLNKTKDIIMKGTFGHVSVRGLDMVVVKGRAKPVYIYEIVSLPGGDKSVITECEAKEVIQFKEK
jgi:adenylate cyclase